MEIAMTNIPTAMKLDWTMLSLTERNVNDAVLGMGSFGTVIKAHFRNADGSIDVDVAVKVLTRSSAKLASTLDFEGICNKTFREVEVMAKAESQMVVKDSITHVYGMIQGELPAFMTSMFRMHDNEYGIGIVMRLEAGGSLESYMAKHGNNMNMETKLRFLRQIATGLSELHFLGIIHGDIKPENILLSDENATHLRLADFGLSTVLDDSELLGDSSLRST